MKDVDPKFRMQGVDPKACRGRDPSMRYIRKTLIPSSGSRELIPKHAGRGDPSIRYIERTLIPSSGSRGLIPKQGAGPKHGIYRKDVDPKFRKRGG